MCKHVAALLDNVAKQVMMGRNVAGTSKLQEWHQPAKLRKSAFLEYVTPRKASKDMAGKATSKFNFSIMILGIHFEEIMIFLF